ncbi:hypothetical protein EVAR_16339_1 [Eumeta japonica]|uniref:Uncharacterized protein n=1 Tax=Eumeta variegata TaxID=151549 RepID=A0A4C1VHM2_EUMVA|nr:hypothetical protein EVAR_16339_1 [Eumeta japonica]
MDIAPSAYELQAMVTKMNVSVMNRSMKSSVSKTKVLKRGERGLRGRSARRPSLQTSLSSDNISTAAVETAAYTSIAQKCISAKTPEGITLIGNSVVAKQTNRKKFLEDSFSFSSTDKIMNLKFFLALRGAPGDARGSDGGGQTASLKPAITWVRSSTQTVIALTLFMAVRKKTLFCQHEGRDNGTALGLIRAQVVGRNLGGRKGGWVGYLFVFFVKREKRIGREIRIERQRKMRDMEVQNGRAKSKDNESESKRENDWKSEKHKIGEKSSQEEIHINLRLPAGAGPGNGFSRTYLLEFKFEAKLHSAHYF